MTTVTENSFHVTVEQSNVRVATVGTQGPAGPGVVTGGLPGQVLKKLSSANFDAAWQDDSGNIVIQSSTEPSSAKEGDMWFNIATGTLNFYVGGVWTPQEMDGGFY